MTQHWVWTWLGVSWRRIFCEILTRCTQRIRDLFIMRYINLRFTYLLTYLARHCSALVHCMVCLFSASFAGNHCAYPYNWWPDCQSELPRVAGYILRWSTCSQTITRPSTGRTRCRVTSLNETAALPLFCFISLWTAVQNNNKKLSYCCDSRSYCMQYYDRLK